MIAMSSYCRALQWSRAAITRPYDRQAAASNFDDDDDNGGVTIIIATNDDDDNDDNDGGGSGAIIVTIAPPLSRDGPQQSARGMRRRDCRWDNETAESSAGHRATMTG
jgi:hypothetical protein